LHLLHQYYFHEEEEEDLESNKDVDFVKVERGRRVTSTRSKTDRLSKCAFVALTAVSKIPSRTCLDADINAAGRDNSEEIEATRDVTKNAIVDELKLILIYKR
jgi:hypothetical protein